MTIIYPFAEKPTLENSSPIDNFILDEVMPTMRPTSVILLTIMLRHYGRPISYDEIISIGGMRRNLSYKKLKEFTGFKSMETVASAIGDLEKRGLVEKTVKSGYVYFISMADFVFWKIGCTKNIDKRLRQLDIGPRECRVVYRVATHDMYALEKLFHEKFKSKHVRREWYALDDADLLFIEQFPDIVESDWTYS